ncbi:MAG: hypothetical protein ACYDCJ_12465 [Gammaproteobacteria bacterium]
MSKVTITIDQAVYGQAVTTITSDNSSDVEDRNSAEIAKAAAHLVPPYQGNFDHHAAAKSAKPRRKPAKKAPARKRR